MWRFHAGLLLVVTAAAYCIYVTRRELQTRYTFCPSVVTMVWALCILHAFLTVGAAWWRAWPLPLPRTLAIVIGGGWRDTARRRHGIRPGRRRCLSFLSAQVRPCR